MGHFHTRQTGRYTVVYRDGPVDVHVLVEKVRNPDRRVAAGRGAPGVFCLGGQTLVCRQYIHGGWLRGITGGMFFSEERALSELQVTAHLEEKGFPVVSPFGFVVERRLVTKNLFFLSVFLENALDLMDYFRSASQKERLRMSKKLALQLFRMGRMGVYHPDMHLRNVLVTADKEIHFLDFDRACRKSITPGDYEKMFWRLDRYVLKYSSFFGSPVNAKEKLLFLRTYERLSGQRIIASMKKKQGKKSLSAKTGWFIDRFFYGGKENRA